MEMGSYVFRWNQTAEEVSVRGSFNNWDQSIQLKKSNGGFEKQIDIPTTDKKIYYKFIVDGNWVTDPNMPTESDSSGNANNVLSPDIIDKIPAGGRSGSGVHESPNTVSNILAGIGPGASTLSRAGNVPLTKDLESTSIDEAAANSAHADEKMPGAFPEPTPSNEGTYPPIDLFPGDMVPDYATYNSATHPSRSSGNDSSTARDPETQIYGVSPIPASSGYGNPIKLEPGQPVPDSSEVTSNDLQSNVTTDEESYEKSGSAPFSSLGGAGAGLTGIAAAGAAGVAGLFGFGSTKKSDTTVPESSLPIGDGAKDVEQDENPIIRSAAGQDTSTSALAGQVPLEPRGVPQVVQESQQAAKVDPEASQSSELVSEKRNFEDELMQKVPEEQPIAGSAANPSDAASGVPQVVTASQQKVNADPEALRSPEVITEKSAMENELKQVVLKEQPTSETTEAAAGVPGIVQESQQAAGVDPEAAQSATAVTEKRGVEEELKQRVPEQQSENENKGVIAAAVGGATVAGAAAIGGLAYASQKAGVPQSIQDKISSMNTTPAKPADDVPRPVTDSYERSSKDPEAAANPEAVSEKKDMEKELLQDVKTTDATGEPAPTMTAAHITQAPGSGNGVVPPTDSATSELGGSTFGSNIAGASAATSGNQTTSGSTGLLADGAGYGTSAAATTSDALQAGSTTNLRSADPSSIVSSGTSASTFDQPSFTAAGGQTFSNSTGLLAGAAGAGELGTGALAYGSGVFSSTSGASSRAVEPTSSDLTGQSTSTAADNQLASSNMGSSSYESSSRITDPSTIPSFESNSMIADADTMPAIALANGDAVQPSEPTIGNQESSNAIPLASSSIPTHTIGTGPSYMMARGSLLAESSSVAGASEISDAAATGTVGTYPASIPATELSSTDSPMTSGTSTTRSGAYDSYTSQSAPSSSETPAASGIFASGASGTTGTIPTSSATPLASGTSEVTGHNYGRDAALLGGTSAIGAAGAAAYMGYNSHRNIADTTAADMAPSTGVTSSSAGGGVLASSSPEITTGPDMASPTAMTSSSLAGSGLSSSARDVTTGSGTTSTIAGASNPSSALPAGAFVDDTPNSVRSATSGAAPSMGTTNASRIGSDSTRDTPLSTDSSRPVAELNNSTAGSQPGSSAGNTFSSAGSNLPVAGAYSSTAGSGLSSAARDGLTETRGFGQQAYSTSGVAATTGPSSGLNQTTLVDRSVPTGASEMGGQGYSTSGISSATAPSSSLNQTTLVDRSVSTETSSGSGFVPQPATSTASNKPLAAPEDPASRTSAPATDIAARVLGAGTMPAYTAGTGASSSVTAGTAGAIGATALGAGAIALGSGVHESRAAGTATSASSRASAAPMTSSGDARRSTSRGVFDQDPVSAVGSSAPAITSAASTLDPRTVASAFANDPISASGNAVGQSRTIAAPATSSAATTQSNVASTSAATSGATSGSTSTGTSGLIGGGAAGIIGGGAAAGLVGGGIASSATSSGTKSGPASGLNASAKDPALSAATAAMAKENVAPAQAVATSNTSKTGPAMTTPPKSASRAGGLSSGFGSSSKQKAVSRDVSPHSRGDAGPSTTTGIASSSVPTRQGPSTPQKGGKTSTTGTPASASASTPGSGTPKSEKRRSKLGTWFKEHVTERKSSKK